MQQDQLQNTFPSHIQTIKKLKEDNSFEKQWNSLLHWDILANKDKEKQIKQSAHEIIQDFQKSGKKNLANSLDKCLGCFIGLAIGDSLGNITDGFQLSYERNDVKGFQPEQYEKQLRLPLGMISDDTSLALCLADSLIENNYEYNFQDFRHRVLLWWYEGYNNGKHGYFKKGSQINQDLPELKENVKKMWGPESFGIGLTVWNSGLNFVRNSTSEYSEQNQGNQNANGTLMRLAPIPILYRNNLQKALDIGQKQSYATHNGLQAAECCQVMTYLIIKLINNQSTQENDLQEIFNQIFKEMQQDLDLEDQGVISLVNSQIQQDFEKDEHNKIQEDVNWNWKSPQFKFSPTRTERHNGSGIGGYCMDSLAMALHIVYFSKNFEECVLKTANLGGDADTVGSITGQIAGAYYGIGQKMIDWYEKSISMWDEYKVLYRCYMLHEQNSK